MSKNNCTYRFTGPDGQERTIQGMAAMKAFLADGGLEFFYPDGKFPWLKTEAAQVGAKSGTKAGTITDFGEKIGGAKKDLWTGFKDDLAAVSDDDIASQPLSKVWPAPDYQALIESGTSPDVVAFIRAARDEIPAKPRVGYKVKGWASKVKTLRGLALDMISGKTTMKDVQAQMEKDGAISSSMQGFMGRVELYQAFGHGKSLEGIRMSWQHYTLYRGQQNVSMWVVEQDAKATAWSNFPRELATGKTKEEAIESFRKAYEKLGADKEAKKGVQFDIIHYRGQDGYWISKKLGRNHVKVHGPLATVKEAREYRDQHQAELVAKLEKIKEIPNERRETNEPRVGEDMRNGADVTPELFGQTFGFRGVEFGNWVEQGRRQRDLNDAFDALMDMAAILGIPPKAISLNGQLGLAFGARGTGGSGMVAAAHYEPDKVVINLTKKSGAGSLGHEWWHAVDNYFAKMRREQGGSFMTTSRDVLLASRGSGYVPYAGVRPEMIKAFGDVVKAINLTGMKQRAAVLDGKRSKEYWATGEEMSARAYEAYLINKLQDQNVSNDYLANIVSEEAWNAAAALGLENENSYPYPLSKEVPGIRAAFDNFFQTVQTREDDKGNVALFSVAPDSDLAASMEVSSPAGSISEVELDSVIKGALNGWKAVGGDMIATVQSASDLPAEIVQGAKDQGLDLSKVEGVQHRGKVYLVRENLHSAEQAQRVLFHEVLGHLGVKGALSGKTKETLRALWTNLGSLKGVEAMARKIDAGDGKTVWDRLQPYTKGGALTMDRQAIIMDELIAYIAQGNDQRPMTRFKAYLSNLKADVVGLLRKLKLGTLADRLDKAGADLDVLALVRDARKAIETGKTRDGQSFTFTTRTAVALTGKQYSAKLSPSPELLSQVRERYQSVESQFRAGFDALTESEARYLAKHDNAQRVRDRITEAGDAARQRATQGTDQGNQGLTDPGGDAPRFSVASSIKDKLNERKTTIVGAGGSRRVLTPEQTRAMANVGFQVEEPSIADRAKELWKDAGKKLAQGLADQFAPVKELDGKAYSLLRLAKGASGAFEVLLQGGKLKLNDGVYDFDDTKRGGVVDKLLKPLGGEHHYFLQWVAANRAERLMAEGKENLFTPEDVRALKTLATGQTDFDYTIQNGVRQGQVTRDRATIYADSLVTFNGFNKNVLDLAEQSGLIDGDSRSLWEQEFYVPFYRVADEMEGGVRGMNIKGGAVRQEAFKKLKGGKQALNADLLDNTLMNWAHLLDASAKNRAAKATLEAAAKMGVAVEAPESTVQQMGKSINKKGGAVWFMDGGVKRHFLVDDPYLMTAITSLEYAGMRGPMMDAMGAFKRALTVGVTASPFFKVRGLIRDSLQVVAVSKIGTNPLANVKEGWKLTDPHADAYFRLVAGGGTIHFGTMMEGSEAKRVQALVESGVESSTILDSDNKVKAFYRRYMEPAITAYNELGNRGEAVNRAALYNQLISQGVSHAEASLMARDLMDFSMQGSFTSVRFLTQVVPFLNARIQGLYKLRKAAKEDPQRFAAVIGATALMSVALLAAYSDDDDWKKREEWDRNNYWWFKFGGTAFRIPKPFEIGAMATLAERGVELLIDDEMTGPRFRQQILTLLSDNLSMNLIPQLVKPMLDVYANKDSFSGRPIETMGMERLLPQYRYNDRTSMLARGASSVLNGVAGTVGGSGPSPVQIDHMIRGYFGWLGSFVVGTSDILARPATGQADRSAPDYWKTATGGLVSKLDGSASRYVSQMYEQSKAIEQAYGTWRALLKEGRVDEAAAFREDHADQIAANGMATNFKTAQSNMNNQIRVIERSTAMSASEKRDAINAIRDRQDQVARGFRPIGS
ncbi:LPD38 domain-containing protein [Aquabacterium sp.]|uniref:LPD38 domain-containing protein n=1 Tax=Aquabacterium sp. TaxID=1872578 RepID=UPI0035B2313B